jgi:HlyD family secretion protein
MRVSQKIIIIIIALAVVSCSVKTSGRGKGMKDKPKTLVVETGEITVKLEETGVIEPIKEIDIKSRVSGKILNFYVEEGDFVEKNQLIAKIEPDYNQAETISRIKNNLELAEIRLRNAERDYEDQQQMFNDEYISANELSDYKDALAEARINFNAASQQFELIREIDTEGNVSNIISTASGTVIQKSVEEGEMVVASTSSFSEGTVILKLADLERMIVNSRINEVDISKIQKDQKVDIQVDAYPYDKYTGIIYKIAAMAVEFNNIKVFPIEIEIDKVDSKLRPGMTANITIIGEKKSEIVVVPIRAIFSDDDGQDIVYKVSKDTLITQELVKTGINNFQQVEIIEGIAAGDTISLSEPADKEMKIDFQFE